MRKIFICFLALFAFTGTAAYAGSGHSHGPATLISESQALEKATRIVKSIVKKGKLDSSWAEVGPTAGVQKQTNLGREWVITFDNPRIEEKGKQTLYVFLSLGGKYIAANYSGS